MGSVTALEDTNAAPAVRGFLHQPDAPDGRGLVLTHGAGSNAGAPLLVAVAELLAAAGIMVLRADLPWRQAGDDAGGGRSGPGCRTLVALVPAASAEASRGFAYGSFRAPLDACAV